MLHSQNWECCESGGSFKQKKDTYFISLVVNSDISFTQNSPKTLNVFYHYCQWSLGKRHDYKNKDFKQINFMSL